MPPFHLMAKPSSLHCNIRYYIEANQSQREDFVWQGEPTLPGLDFYNQVVKYQQKFANGKRSPMQFKLTALPQTASGPFDITDLYFPPPNSQASSDYGKTYF